MAIHRDQLVFAALCVVDEAAHACHDAPIKPSVGLRFALSYLYSVAGGERRMFADFLLAIQSDEGSIEREGERRYVRATRASSHLKGIIRTVGYPQTPEAAHKLSAAWRGKP